MTTTDPQTDELLSALADGELNEQQATELRARLAREPALMQRFKALKRADSDIQALMERIDREPLPDSVIEMIEKSDSGHKDNVVELPVRRRLPLLDAPIAIAASVALAVGFISGNLFRQPQPETAILADLGAGTVSTDTQLHALLEQGTSGTSVSLGEGIDAEVILSLQSATGEFCRQLRVDTAGQSSHGLACRGDEAWQMHALAFAPAASGAVQPASGPVPEIIDLAVGRLLDAGQILSKKEESAAAAAGWMP